jgi:hypothetical protein
MKKKPKGICGTGVNDADYPVCRYENVDGKSKLLWKCPLYQVWVSMIKRCYSSSIHNKFTTYSGCSVVPSWEKFSAFREWMESQDWKGKQLDKDILIPGNKVYGPDTCVFVSGQLNSFMTDSGAARGALPTGVSLNKQCGKFRAQCSNPFTVKIEILGLFADSSDAHEAWRARKHEHACRYADMQTDLRIADALRKRYAAV